MGLLYNKHLNDQELTTWWNKEIDEVKFVGMDNTGDRVEYIARSAEEIQENIDSIADRLSSHL